MILAIDQGASKTSVALVSTQGEILATATAGGACYFSVGIETAFREIHAAVGQAAEKAGLSPDGITRVYGGIAGANWPDEIEMLTEQMHTHFNTRNVNICNDCVIALRGGSDKPDGIVICAGSGLNGAVKADGEVRYVFNNYVSAADQGGGALGGRAVEAVFESHIGFREKTILTGRILEYYGYDNVDQLLLGRDRGTLKYPLRTVVNVLLEAADENDRVAQDVIYEFSKSVARYAAGGLRKFGLIGKDCDIVLSGGVFKSCNPLFFETISAEIHRVSVQARIVHAKYEPVVGAALLGLGEIGASPEAIALCKQNARKFGLIRRMD